MVPNADVTRRHTQSLSFLAKINVCVYKDAVGRARHHHQGVAPTVSEGDDTTARTPDDGVSRQEERTPMTSTQWLRRVLVTAGLTAACLAATVGAASADPLSDALATTPCSYAQVTAAMNAQTPELAAQLNLRPDMQANLQSFLALPVDQRRQRISQEQAANPQLQQILTAMIGPQVSQVASSCMSY